MADFFVIVLVLSFLIGIREIWQWHVERSLVKKRGQGSFKQFRRQFVGKEIDDGILLAIYNELQRFTLTKDFPILYSDSLENTYGIIGEDLDALAEDICRNLEIKKMSRRQTDRAVKTVEDIVSFINSCWLS